MSLSKISRTKQILSICIFFILVITVIPFTTILIIADSPSTWSESFAGIRGSRATVDRVIPDSKVMYAIIAPQAFEDTLIPLVNWKTYKGVPAKIFTLESILTTSTSGRDEAENLHKFLSYLDETSKALTWVLLVGDSDIMPTRNLTARAKSIYGLDDKYVSDFYYAVLNEDWDDNNDGMYGDGIDGSSSLQFEGAWDADVYVGRLPVGNKTELSWCVDDILNYEINPNPGTWLKKVLLWGGLMDAPNDLDSYNPQDTNGYKAKHQYVKPIIQDKAPHMLINERYDYSQLQGGSYQKSNDQLYDTVAVSDWNSGATLVNYAGQAFYEGVAIIDYTDSTGLKHIGYPGAFAQLYNWQDALAASNGKMLPLLTAFTCGAGNFSSWGAWHDKTLERLFANPNGGAIGMVASTGKTYRGELYASDGNWYLDKIYYEIFFNGIYQPGRTLFELKDQYRSDFPLSKSSYPEVYKAMLFGYNYFGDPELNIWTDTPSDLEIEVNGLWRGPHNITVKAFDKGGTPIPNARVCIQNNDIYVYGVTNSTGIANIFANPTKLNSVEIVVTAHNFLPYNQSFNIGIEPPDLSITNSDIELSNGNPITNYQIYINATVLNRGGTDLTTDAIVRFTLDGRSGEGGTTIGSDQTISSLATSNSKTVGVTWVVEPGEHVIYVEADPDNEIVESYESNNVASKIIYGRRAELYIATEDITFSPDILNLDAYQGNNVDVKAMVHNSGEAPAYNVKVSFIEKSEVLVQRYIGNKTIGVLQNNHSKPITATWLSVGGEHEITVQIDPEDKIPEFNENNNTASINVTLKYPPVIRPLLPDLELPEDTVLENATNLIWYISDEDTEMADLIITLICPDDNCTVQLNDYFSFDVIPSADWNGVVNVSILVSDGLVSANDTFMINVLPVPDAPRFNDSYTLIATEDEEFTHFVKAYDPDGDPITFSDDTEIFEIDTDSGEIRFTPTQDHVNNSPINITITVSDGLLSTKQIFKLIVENTPDPPIIFPIPDQYTEVGKKFVLQVVAKDVDSSELFYYDKTSLFSIDIGTGLIAFTPAPSDVGTHVIKIIVSDEDYLSANTTFKLHINASSEPPPTVPDNNETEQESHELDIGLYLTIISILIIIIIIVLAVLVLRKRKVREKALAKDFFSPQYEHEHDKLSHYDPEEERRRLYGDHDQLEQKAEEKKEDEFEDSKPEPGSEEEKMKPKKGTKKLYKKGTKKSSLKQKSTPQLPKKGK